MTNESIRFKIEAQGWKLLEIPIKKMIPNTNEKTVSSWKIVASKGDRSVEIYGKTIDEALINIATLLGIIKREIK